MCKQGRPRGGIVNRAKIKGRGYEKNQLLVHFYATIWKFFEGEGLKNDLQGGNTRLYYPCAHVCLILKINEIIKDSSKSQAIERLFLPPRFYGNMLIISLSTIQESGIVFNWSL